MANEYRSELGLLSSSIRVGRGATLLFNKYVSMDFQYTFDGGALAFGAAPASQGRQVGDTIILEGDAAFVGKQQQLVRASYKPVQAVMNGNTLSVNLDAAEKFGICNVTFTGEGQIVGVYGWLNTLKNPSVGENVRLVFPYDSGGVWLGANFTVKDFISNTHNYHKGDDVSMLSVLGEFRPGGAGITAFPNTRLADGATLDLS